MRIANSIKNTKYAVISQIITVILKFICQSVFIKYLGIEYLGVNGLFSNILTILGLAELGIGTAIIYNLYKPLAFDNKNQIQEYMNFYKKVYNFIGIFILITGFALVPFLKYFIKGESNIENIHLLYILYLGNTIFTYFFAYKRSLIIADQKSYLNTLNYLITSIFQVVLQIIFLITTKSFVIYLIIQLVCTFISNVFISLKANKMYPYLKHNKKRLNKSEQKKLWKDIYAVMSQRVGYVLINGTDNLIISTFIGVQMVGMYSNYILVISAIKNTIGQIFNAISASIGNLNALESKDKSYLIYNVLLFSSFWIVGFVSIAYFILINPFITLWIGKEYLLNNYIVLLIVANYFFSDTTGIRIITNNYKDSLGLFWYERYKAYIQAGINILCSVILVNKIGFIGVLLGTFISTIATCFWFEPYVLFKYGFHKPLRLYFFKFLKYFFCICSVGVITYMICFFSTLFIKNIWIIFILKILIAFIVPNFLLVCIFYNSYEFKYLFNIFKSYFKKI